MLLSSGVSAVPGWLSVNHHLDARSTAPVSCTLTHLPRCGCEFALALHWLMKNSCALLNVLRLLTQPTVSFKLKLL